MFNQKTEKNNSSIKTADILKTTHSVSIRSLEISAGNPEDVTKQAEKEMAIGQNQNTSDFTNAPKTASRNPAECKNQEADETEQKFEKNQNTSDPPKLIHIIEKHTFWHETFERVYYHTLPNWLRDNDFLLAWHRPPMPSFIACFKSIFKMHSETVNIWTHLFGCALLTIVALYFFKKPPDIMHLADKAIFGLFFVTSVLCMALSAMYHILACHSEAVTDFFRKLDYLGIAAFILGSFIPWLYYSFYYRIVAKFIYLSMVIVLSIACVVVSMLKKFNKPDYRAYRFGLFALLVFSGVAPLSHHVMMEGVIASSSIIWLLLSLATYGIGGVIYSSRIPERYSPGQFDVWFQSHQIFHVFVVIAAVFHYYGLYDIAFDRLTKKLTLS